MSHGPPVQLGEDRAAEFKARLGLLLFFVYGLVYAGFIVINTLSPKTMGEAIVWGLNLAVVYGVGLIVFAVVLGVIYNAACTRAEQRASIESAGAAKADSKAGRP